jgi:SAM-dependent methyltransferase
MESGLKHFIKKYPTCRKLAVNETIHDDDEMYLFLARIVGAPRARMFYFKLGCDLARTIMQIARWRFGRKTQQIKVMEFACGYGRNLRHIVRAIPAENMFVSDIYENAVKFCVEQFGVRGRLSVHDPSDLDWLERFDLIVVPSLFSHLPEATFSGWIAALHDLLTDKGILVFSVHGDHLLTPGVSMPESGIIFVQESESSTLDKSEYGSSWVSETFVSEQIHKATGHPRYSRTRRGFWNHQDFYLIAKDASADLSSFRYDHGVVGKLDTLEAGSGRSFKFAGWAKDTSAARALDMRIVVSLGGRKIAESVASGQRFDVARIWTADFAACGFDFEAKSLPARLRRNSLLVVEAVSGRRRECLYALSLNDALPDLGPVFDNIERVPVLKGYARALAGKVERRWTNFRSLLRGA